MKRYIVLDEPYGGKGILGSVDSLDDIPPYYYEALDTTTGILYQHSGAKWEPDGEVADGLAEEEEPVWVKQELSGTPCRNPIGDIQNGV